MLTTLSDELFNIEVAQDIDLLNFKALCEFECGIPASQIAILWNGRPLHDDKLKLKDYGIGDGEMLLIQRIQGARGNPSTGASGPSRSPGPGGEWNAAYNRRTGQPLCLGKSLHRRRRVVSRSSANNQSISSIDPFFSRQSNFHDKSMFTSLS